MIPFQKKEFTVFTTVETVLLIGLIIAFAIIVFAGDRVSPDLQRQLDESQKMASITESKVPESLWNTAGNEAVLLANTVEAEVPISVYVLYRAGENSYEYNLITNTLGENFGDDERELMQIKYQNALASSKLAERIRDKEDTEVSGIIVNWNNNSGERYSLVEVNGDGSWDYLAKGTEARFSTDSSGELVYTDDTGEETRIFVDGDVKQIVESKLLLSEAENAFQ